jgi:hypothetical protein
MLCSDIVKQQNLTELYLDGVSDTYASTISLSSIAKLKNLHTFSIEHDRPNRELKQLVDIPNLHTVYWPRDMKKCLSNTHSKFDSEELMYQLNAVRITKGFPTIHVKCCNPQQVE